MVERAERFICYFAPWTLDGSVEICKLRFSIMATLANPIEDPLQEFEYPQREAAFFYGLFLRGHSAEELRKGIRVCAVFRAKGEKEPVREPQLRPLLERIVQYRQHVLVIFENLICHDSTTKRLQQFPPVALGVRFLIAPPPQKEAPPRLRPR